MPNYQILQNEQNGRSELNYPKLRKLPWFSEQNWNKRRCVSSRDQCKQFSKDGKKLTECCPHKLHTGIRTVERAIQTMIFFEKKTQRRTDWKGDHSHRKMKIATNIKRKNAPIEIHQCYNERMELIHLIAKVDLSRVIGMSCFRRLREYLRRTLVGLSKEW